MNNIELALKHGAVLSEYGFDARAGVAFTAIADLDAYTAAVQADAIAEHIAQPVQPAVENIREGAPYDNSTFEELCRNYGIWGTAQAALCAAFWQSALAQPVQLSPPCYATLRDVDIEALAMKYEAFGFGFLDAEGVTTHGFEPDGLIAFVKAIMTTAQPVQPAGYWNKDMDKLNMLLARCKCGVFLTVNEHRDYYETAAQRLDGYYGNMECPPDVAEDMRQRMIQSDTIIDLQFYPATPIGSYQILDCDLDSALDRALACLDIEAK